MILDLLNAKVLEGTELKEVAEEGEGGGTILTQHSHHQNDSALKCKPSSINCEGQGHKATFYGLTPTTSPFDLAFITYTVYLNVKGLVKAVFVCNGTLKIDPIMKV